MAAAAALMAVQGVARMQASGAAGGRRQGVAADGAATMVFQLRSRTPGALSGMLKAAARDEDQARSDGVRLVRVGPVVGRDAARGSFSSSEDDAEAGVAAERGDVVAHPLDGGALVAQSKVLRFSRGHQVPKMLMR